MRHSATGELIHVDSEAVPHFGYLPQDMIGVSVFDFFHPEDMQYLKEVHMTSESCAQKVAFASEIKLWRDAHILYSGYLKTASYGYVKHQFWTTSFSIFYCGSFIGRKILF